VDKLSELYQKGVSRRNFLVSAGAAGTVSVLAGCGNNSPATITPTPLPMPGIKDVDILNFALNLEYLEASFYLYAATGQGLPTASMGTNPGTVVAGATQLTGLSTLQQNIINEIAFDELSHVNFLRAAITGAGATPVSMPNLNITTAFNTLAAAATIGPTFNPYTSFNNFLLGAFVFEDVGVSAYSGAAPLLTSSAILNYAAGIQAVEAYHAAYVRTSLTGIAQATGNNSLITTANLISALRGSLGGGKETPLIALPATIAANGYYAPSAIVAADASAIAFSRTTDQVLHIVYGTGGGAGVASGVFFPNGLNGTIKTTAS
jgi:hypothetical protein